MCTEQDKCMEQNSFKKKKKPNKHHTFYKCPALPKEVEKIHKSYFRNKYGMSYI